MQDLNGNGLLEFGEFQLDTEKKILRRNGEIVPLPLKAVELLSVLVKNHGEVVTKDVLMETVWGDSFVEDSVLTQNIYSLRKTLKSGGGKNLIKNVPRRGYLFTSDVSLPYETIIERHLYERVTIEESVASVDEEKQNAIVLPHSSPRRKIFPYVLTGFAATLLAVGLYLYFVGDARQTVSATPAINFKAVSVPSAIKSLAVLPMKSTDEAFSASFANDLSIRLGAINKFRVVPNAIVKECEKNGAELKIDFVLNGNVEAKDDRYSANVNLIDTQNNRKIWSNRFEFDNLIQLQDAITNQASKALVDQLTPDEREVISKRLPSNLAAYENFQTGYSLWRRRESGADYLKKAIELDANFAPAYAMLACRTAMDSVKGSAGAKNAEDLLQKAFELDDNLADAYAVHGFIRIFHHRDWAGAETSLQNALALDANNVNAHHWLGVFYSINRRLDEAKAEMQKALDCDPTNPTLLADTGQLHYFAGENDQAIEYCNKALAINPDHGFAKQYLNQINIPIELREAQAVLKQLENFADENSFALPYINVDPKYDKLRELPRFQAILRKMNL